MQLSSTHLWFYVGESADPALHVLAHVVSSCHGKHVHFQLWTHLQVVRLPYWLLYLDLFLASIFSNEFFS